MKYSIATPETRRAILCLVIVLLITGCRTIAPNAVGAFATGVTAAKSQSSEAFQAVNDLIADSSLDFAAKQDHLIEANFAAGLPTESLLIWEQSLEKLEQYAQHLQQLTSPDIAKPFEEAAQNLGISLQDFGNHLSNDNVIAKAPQIDPRLATGFTELGSIIIRLKAQSNAQKIAASSDEGIHKMLLIMADSVGATATNGIRLTVKHNWEQLLADKKDTFIHEADKSRRHQVAAEFLELMQRRDAQDLVLLSLRRSLLGVSDLHHALAKGQAWNAQAAAAAIIDEVKHTKELNQAFKQKLGKQP